MKNKIDFLEFEKEISNIPIGVKVKDKNTALNVRSQISNYNSPEDIVIDAIKNNDLNLLQFIFENTKVDTTIEDSDGRNLLYIAVASGGVEVAEYILKNTNINPLTILTPPEQDLLHVAVHNGIEGMVQFIIENTDLHPSYYNSDTQGILHHAAKVNNVDAIAYILKKNIVDINSIIYLKGNFLQCAVRNGSMDAVKYILENTDIDRNALLRYNGLEKNLLHCAIESGDVDMLKYIIENTEIDPTVMTKHSIGLFRKKTSMSILDLAIHKNAFDIIKYIIEERLINISTDIYDKMFQLYASSSSFSIEDIFEIDFSKQKLDVELFLEMLEKYVFTPQCTQKTIGEIKDIYIKKLENANLPETLIKVFSDRLNEWAESILIQESYLMSQDYALYTENCKLDNIYYELPLLIKHFNPDREIEIYGLKKWFENFPNLNKQLDNFINSVKELQNFVEFPDKKEETEAKIEQLIAKLKTKLIEQVYNDVAGVYLNKLAKLPNDEILMKCIVNEHFAGALKSINPLFFNTEIQDKFSDIIEEYEVEKDKLRINFQDFIITEGSGPNDDATDPKDKTPMGEHETGSSLFE